MFFFLFGLAGTASPQGFKHFKDHCGLYYASIAQLNRQMAAQVSFYGFQPQQTIASIGAQCANWEAALATTTDSSIFYLEDIDSTYLNQSQAGFAWRYYSSLKGRPLSSSYRIMIGDELKTHLLDRFFDKIIVMDSFHEFTHPKEMLADLGLKLKPDGILYIDETLAKKPGDLHTVCKKRIFTESEMIEIFKQNGFLFVRGLALNFRKAKPAREIFAFKKA